MAITYQFGRQITVDVAGIKMTEPRISFEIVKSRDKFQDSGNVKIYNLKRSTHDHIRDRGTAITIDAGYRDIGQQQRIFEGVAQRISKMREDNAFVTNIKLGDVIRSKDSRGGAIEESFAGPTPIRDIIPKLVEAMGPEVELGSMDVIPSGASVVDFVATGAPGDALDILMEQITDRNIRWYTDGNIIRFADGSKPQADVAVRITKTPTSGLIGVPELQEDDHVKIEMLLDPRMRIGGEIVVSGSDYIGDAPLTIMGLVHQGDNFKGRFVTLVDAVPPGHEDETT